MTVEQARYTLEFLSRLAPSSPPAGMLVMRPLWLRKHLRLEAASLALDNAMAERHGPYGGPTPKQLGETACPACARGDGPLSLHHFDPGGCNKAHSAGTAPLGAATTAGDPASDGRPVMHRPGKARHSPSDRAADRPSVAPATCPRPGTRAGSPESR